MSAETGWQRGDWMQTFSGAQFYPMSPQPEDVDPGDIAHALSLLCRYNGHVDRFYSVAEHCVLLSHAVSPENALWALLHDATEAYVGDMIRPLKRHMPDYVDAEDRVMVAIAQRFSLGGASISMAGDAIVQMPAEVKDADTRILLDEKAALLSHTRHAWGVDGLQPLGVRVEGWLPLEGERRYTERLFELLDARAESLS